MLKKIVSFLVVAVLLLTGAAGCSSGSPGADDKADKEKEAETKPDDPDMTEGQKTAVDDARYYLESDPTSRNGLIEQLTSEYGEGLDPEDAEWAVSYLEDRDEVDWDEQAVKYGKKYADQYNTSIAELVDTLSDEHGGWFEEEQAEKAVQKLEDKKEVDWKKEALDAANGYLEYDEYEKEELKKALMDASHFTEEEAQYAVDQVFKE